MRARANGAAFLVLVFVSVYALLPIAVAITASGFISVVRYGLTLVADFTP